MIDKVFSVPENAIFHLRGHIGNGFFGWKGSS